MLSLGAIHYEDRFCTGNKGGMGGGGWVLEQGAVYIAAALVGYRKALVSTGWAISLQSVFRFIECRTSCMVH